MKQFEEKFFITAFPVFQNEDDNIMLLGIPNELGIAQLEFSKKLVFDIKLPFRVNWQSKSHIDGLILKTYIANLPDSILNTKIKPIGRIKDKKNSIKDSLTCIIQLKNLQPNGSYQGSLEYTYKPQSVWTLDTHWGKKSDCDRKIIQKYTTEQKNGRFPREFEELIQPYKHMDDIYKVSKEIYFLARKMIKTEFLEYRKGIFNLLQDLRGDCDEFTDFMVVLLRRLGFPIRRVTGMTYDFRTGKIVHHAWPEIYAPRYDKWIPIDAAMNYFGFQSLTVIPLKIEGTTVIPHTLEVSFMNQTQKIDVDMTLLDTEITFKFSDDF